MKMSLALQSYPVKSTRENVQQLFNLYAVPDTANGKSSVVLYPTPGLLLFCDTGGQVVRPGGLIQVHGIAYCVKDNHFGIINSGGVFTSKGTINTSSGVVSMAATFDQILLVDGSNAWLYVISTDSWVQVTAASFPANCTYVAAQDQYFLAVVPSSNQFYVSALSDGTTWNSLQFAAITVQANNIVGMKTLFTDLWIFGENGTALWSDTGGLFPFTPQAGSFLNYGCVAPGSIVIANNTIFWLSRSFNGSGVVLTQNSTIPQVISDEGLNYQISTYSRIDDAFGYSYQQEGHEFFVLTFPTPSVTWVYDITANHWHQRNSINTHAFTQPAYTRHRGNCYCFAYGKHLVGDFVSGKVFSLDMNTMYDDGANTIERVAVTPPYSNSGRLVSIYSLELFVEPGQGLISGQGTIPMIGLEISRDGGFTWGNMRLQPLGAMGKYRTRVKWNLLGSARDWCFRFTVTDPNKIILLGAEVDIEQEKEPWPVAVDFRNPR